MNIKLISILDKVVILSIYVIFVLDFPLLVKGLFVLGLLLVFVIYITSEKHKFTMQISLYLLITFAMFSVLAFIGLIKYNDFGIILKFIFPLLILFNIFVFNTLKDQYDMNRYAFHIYVAAVLVALKVIVLFVLVFNSLFMEYLPLFDSEKNQSTWIGFSSGTFRIFTGQATVIPIGLLISSYLYKKVPYKFLIISFFALFFTQTTVLWASYLLVLLYIIHSNYKSIFKYFLLSAITIAIYVAFMMNYDLIISIIDEKLLYSVPVKLQQFEIVYNVFETDMLFGGGLGFIYPNGAFTIEVVLLHILSTTGLVGFVFYNFMLFYWPIVSIRYIQADKLLKVLLLSYFTVVFASFSNPYLIGGTSGLFLIPIISARYTELKTINTQKKYAT
ncbi:MAG: hypothetical protein C0602_10445 [Denitrovibrio sp.]|nr:MAG: hypothetical protein C0602_10445 [Denitrovibrio sp.]